MTIAYNVKWTTVEGLLLRAAMKTDGLLHDPSPFVLVKSLDNYYVTYEVNGYTNRQNEIARIHSDLTRNALERFDEAGVEILSPQYIALRDSAPAVRRRHNRGTTRTSPAH